MPVRVSKLNAGDGLKSLTIPFGDETLTIKYSRKKYTPKLEKEMQEQAKDSRPGGMLSTFLLSLISWWDVVDFSPESRDKAEEMETKAEQDGKKLTMEDMEKAGITFIPMPLNEQTFSDILSIEAQGKIVEALAEDQRPNEKPSDFTSNT